MSEQLKQALDSWTSEALQLRFAGPALKPGYGPSDVLDSLLELRQRLDRVEELVFKAVQLRGRVKLSTDVAVATAQDAMDRVVQAARDRGEQYVTAAEKVAEANLATRDQRLDAREAIALSGRCDDAVEMLRLVYKGLEANRQDHLAILRTLQAFESGQDR